MTGRRCSGGSPRRREAAEEAGFDAISVPDHVHQNRVGGGPASPMFEAYTVLGALALATSSAATALAGQPGDVARARAARQGGDHARRDLRRPGRARRRRGLGRRRARGVRYRLPRARRAVRPAGRGAGHLPRAVHQRSRRASPGSSTRCGTPTTRRGRCAAPSPCSWRAAARSARWTWSPGTGTRATCSPATADVRHKFDVLAAHCERVGRDPAEITKTVFAFDTSDLAALAASARSLAAAGADGMIVVGPQDPAAIGADRRGPRRGLPRLGAGAARGAQPQPGAGGGGQRGDAGAHRRLDHRGEQRRVVGRQAVHDRPAPPRSS